MNLNDNIHVFFFFFVPTGQIIISNAFPSIQRHSQRPLVTSPKEGKCLWNVKSGDVKIITAEGSRGDLFHQASRDRPRAAALLLASQLSAGVVQTPTFSPLDDNGGAFA